MTSHAYADLSNEAARLLFDLVRRFNGHNNGEIAMSHRQARELLRVSPRKVTCAFDDLMTHGFIEIETEGAWRERQAREYRLTWLLSGKGPPYRQPSLAYRHWSPGAPALPIKRQRAPRPAGGPRPPHQHGDGPADQSGATAPVAAKGKVATAPVAGAGEPATAPVAVKAKKPQKSAILEIGACYRSGDAYKLPCPPAPANQPGQGDGGHGERPDLPIFGGGAAGTVRGASGANGARRLAGCARAEGAHRAAPGGRGA